ncbi:putative recombination initiation defects 3 isoform X2 [Mangifera indica]|uniref:putative recombination initiation defects 3 isoform X2 n=1 Tax=Mangifera indica TaxID=29780 RepID=UPI001CFA4580|nr:putative recombination initiation defects 3 isoform X2 [Mangifera indica]XP_044504055.1 putative recombination initiation defects 3 isoform X2 [Mangifera indica]
MKLKINKACDLSSISVFPPHARRTNTMPTGLHAQQFRSQPSQQSLSQGLSSQHGMFSQLSQSSLDEGLTNDQRVSSQERENAMKKVPCLPQLSYTREESQMPISRSSTNLTHKWNPTSAPDRKCQISEELERRIGMMETSLNRFGMILDSVQSDLMQVNRGTKEVMLEVEGISQKMVLQSTSLQQLMNKGNEDIKASLDGCLKSLSDQFGKAYEEKFKEILLVFSTLPVQTEASLLKLQNKLCIFLDEKLQAVASSSLKSPNQKCELAKILSQKAMAANLKSLNRKGQMATVASQKVLARRATSQRKPRPSKNPIVPPEVSVQAIQVPKVEMGGWKSVKKPMKENVSNKDHKEKEVSSSTEAKESRIIIDSDEEIDGGFSCLINEKGTGDELIQDVKEETDRLLRKARRKKRKYNNPVIID